MKTLAELKRDAAAGKIRLELVERYGETSEKFPERCKGIRKPVKINTVAITLETEDGKRSELPFGRASLLEYDENSLTIYDPGKRPLNDTEKKVLADFEKYRKIHQFDISYWTMKAFFEKTTCPYLLGFGFVNGKKFTREYDRKGGEEKQYIIDSEIKGNAILRYNVYRV